MRFNEKDMGDISRRKSQLEGRLQHRGPPGTFRETGFRERFFKLVGNLLFYFRVSDLGKIEEEPMGVIVLENYTVSTEPDSISFAFGIVFTDEADKKHVFTARTETDMERWIATLRTSSYQYWKQQFNSLTSQVHSIHAVRNTTTTANSHLTPDPKQEQDQQQRGIQNTAEEDLIRF